MLEKTVCCTCVECGVDLAENEVQLFDGESYCENCWEECTVICTHCNVRILTDEMNGNDSTPLCASCYDYHYSECIHCGRLIANVDTNYMTEDESEPYCNSCYEQMQGGSIHDYSYKPTPIFYGNNLEPDRFLGVELELDYGGKDSENAESILRMGNHCHEHIYIKSDGSLDDGFEIVTHPMTLAYHENTMKWKEVMEEAVSLRYQSHKTSTCGLHVHVNRTCFGSTEVEQEQAIGRILYLVESFWNPLLIFSRRTESQLKRWASRYGIKDTPKEVMETAKLGYRNRYTCVNLTNQTTIEFRIFRGTLRYNTLIATLQLVDELCNVAILFSDAQTAALSWSVFVQRLDWNRHRALIQYLKEKRLYINEPVEVLDEEE